MKVMTALLAGAALTLMTASAMATTLDPSVTRQVQIGTSSVSSEGTLQSELNKIFGAGKVDAATDQLGVGMFKVSTPGSNLIAPQFKFEWTGNESTQGIGIFGWDGTNAVQALIFGGVHNAGDFANVIWNTQTSGSVLAFDAPSNAFTVTNFTGISKDFFGFYFQPLAGADPTYFSVDALNPDGTLGGTAETRVLAYDGFRAGIPNSGIAFTYEDGVGFSNDWDYNDGGFFVESISAVPEPGTMMLLGAGFLGLAIYGKRRKNA